MPTGMTEAQVEEAALTWLRHLNFDTIHGPDIGPDSPSPERNAAYTNTILERRLHLALKRLNPTLPPEALEDAYRQLTTPPYPSLIQNNRHFHHLLINGIDVTFQDQNRTRTKKAAAIDWQFPERNNWIAVSQFSVRKEGTIPNPNNPLLDTRRPDIVIFCNGLPLVVIELKNAGDAKATTLKAYNDLQTYQREIPHLFYHNVALIAADGTDARLGTITSPSEWFKQWKTIDGDTTETHLTLLECLLKGVLAPHRFLDLMRYFTVFADEDEEDELPDGRIRHRTITTKKMAQYHQYHAVNKAIAQTQETVTTVGENRVGVLWHTQGSGKSLSMLFYAGKISQDTILRNPTLVVLTDRNDLDDQLFDTFAAGKDLLRQTPHQATSRDDLRRKLQVASGGVVFTTIQKFSLTDDEAASSTHPQLSDRDNIVFIVDEAHRTQYGFEVKFRDQAGQVKESYGFAKYVRDALPNAAFIGFTGTPVSLTDRNTRHVFGDYIDIYDIYRSVQDKATVPIYYEARHAKIGLPPEHIPTIDLEFETVTQGEDEILRSKLQAKWSQIHAIVSNPKRLAVVAEDIVTHFEQRDPIFKHGKAMMVCMTREMGVDLYDAIGRLRPDWISPDPDHGLLRVVISGSKSDDIKLQPHIRTKRQLKRLGQQFRKPTHQDFKIVIVCDMWLTGFDAPSLHTMYVDKPMQGHNLMQAISRVNRVYEGKEGGLIVAYLPLELSLQEALKEYSPDDQQEFREVQKTAVPLMQERYELVKAMFHGFDYTPFFTTTDPTVRLTLLHNAINFILNGRQEKKTDYIRQVTALSKAYALANPHETAVAIRREVGFFQAVKAPLVKQDAVGFTPTGKTVQQLDQDVQQIVTKAISPEGIVSLGDMITLPQQNISILSEEFLQNVAGLPQRNLAVEALERLLDDLIRTRRRTYLVQSQSFAERLQESVRRYNNGLLTAAEVLEELLELARDVRAARERGETLGLSNDELAFYDALEVNDSAVAILGDDILKEIAQQLVSAVRKNISIDWELREDARARMRVIIKRILRRYGYPPDKQKTATETVVAQAELLSKQWATF